MMDVRDVVSALPDASRVRRLIIYCLDELAVPHYELSFVLESAVKIVAGLDRLEHERGLSSGEFEARHRAEWEAQLRRCRDAIRDLDKRMKRDETH